MGVGRDAVKLDFTRARHDAPAESRDFEADLYLTENYLELLACDYLRALEVKALLEQKLVKRVPDGADPTDGLRDSIVPAEGVSVDVLRSYLRGFRSAHSRFSRSSRQARDVTSGMIDELDNTGRIRVALLPQRIHPR